MNAFIRCCLCLSALLATTVPQAALVVTQNTNATTLASAVTAAGDLGITVTSAKLSFNWDDSSGPTNVSSGLYTLSGPIPDTYGLTTNGIVLSTGNVSDYGTGTNSAPNFSVDYFSAATPEQEALLAPISAGFSNHFDVTQLDIVFNVNPGISNISFRVVFGTDEFPEFVGSEFIDAFGLYLNGSNIAFAANAPKAPGVSPVNVNHTNMADIAGTELDGVLAPGNNPILTFTAPVVPGSTSNVLTFIIADTSDDIYDSTVYINSLGGVVAPPPSVACSLSSPLDTNTVGQTHTVTATVTTNGVPVAGVNVTFNLTGANGPVQTNITTAGNGQASFGYVGLNTGTDNILAAGGVASDEFSCEATKVWIAEPPPNQPPVAICQPVTTNANASCQATISALAFDGGSFDPDGTIASRSINPTGPFGKGVQQVVLTVTDNNGASASCTTTVTVVDNTLPTITCPANVNVAAPAGQSNVVVNFSAPTAGDNCPGVTTFCTPPSGSTFDLGTTTVTCAAVDTSANTNTCTFNVIVSEAPPEVHDLAIIRLKVPKNINLKGAEPSLTKRVVVQIQNRSPHNETITNLSELVQVTLTNLKDSEGCAPGAVLIAGVPNQPGRVLKPKQKMNIFLNVTFTGGCVPDAMKGVGHEDFSYRAVVNHAALDGNADTHAADDDCPRAALPGGVDNAAGLNIKDTGCAGGVDLKTDVFTKQ